MFRFILLGSFLTIALIPTGSFAQESVSVTNAVEIKKERPPASRYEKLINATGRVLISEKYPVGDPTLRLTARVTYRENSRHLKIFTLEDGNVFIDFDKLPSLISDLEIFVRHLKTAEDNGGDLSFRYSEKLYVEFYSFRNDKVR